MMLKEDLASNLKEYHQEHLVQFYDQLTDFDKEKLTKDIKKVDFADLNAKFLKTKEENKVLSKLDECMKPIPVHLKGSYQGSTPEQLETYETKG